jgi:large subunit ribosomal protein L10
MPITKAQKIEILDKLKDRISRSKSIIFSGFDKLTVQDSESIRKELRSEGGEMIVAKKTLIDLALKQSGMDKVNTRKLDSRVAVVFGFKDEVSPVKVLDRFKKEAEEKIAFLGGYVEGDYLSGKEVAMLASIPSRQELYANMVGSMNAPVSGFVNVLAGSMRSFVYALKAIEEKKAS